MLTRLSKENKETIIVSDINCNYLDKSNGKPIKELLLLNGFTQCVKNPTRITENTETLIDVILSTNADNLTWIKAIPSSLSDHHTIGCVRKLNSKKQHFETVQCRNYKNYNPDNLRNDLTNENWDTVLNDQDPNTAWASMNDILQRNIDKHIPTIVKRVKGRKSAWLTAELKSEMNLCDVLHRKFLKSKSTTDSNAYKAQRNHTNVLVRKAKKQHGRTLLNESANDPGRFWKSLKKMFPLKGKVLCAKSFLIKNKLTANSKAIANGFCSFFSTVANKLKTKVLQIKDPLWAHFFFSLLSMELEIHFAIVKSSHTPTIQLFTHQGKERKTLKRLFKKISHH